MKDQVLGQRIKGKIFIGTIWMFSYYLTDGRMDNAKNIGALLFKRMRMKSSLRGICKLLT